MFAEHQPQLAAIGRRNVDGFRRIATFVLCTIRMPLREAALDYPIVRRGEPARAIFGAKHTGLAALQSWRGEDWHERCEDAYETLANDDAANVIVGILCEIPGIGVVKAGFIAQIIYGLSGCIDTHNLTRFGLTEKHFYLDKSKPSAMKRKHALIRDYNSFCHKIGTAKLWDDWCTYMADNDPVNYYSAEFVSSLHLAPLEC